MYTKLITYGMVKFPLQNSCRVKSLLQNKQRVVNARVSDIYGRLEGRRREGGEEIVWKLKLNVFPVPSQFFLYRFYGSNCF